MVTLTWRWYHVEDEGALHRRVCVVHSAHVLATVGAGQVGEVQRWRAIVLDANEDEYHIAGTIMLATLTIKVPLNVWLILVQVTKVVGVDSNSHGNEVFEPMNKVRLGVSLKAISCGIT